MRHGCTRFTDSPQGASPRTERETPMELFTAPAPAPQPLTEKYRPHRISDFVGLNGPRDTARDIVDNPPETGAFLFIGDPGVGKTTLALAIAEEMGAELHHIPSQDCNLETLRNVVNACHYYPMMGCPRHVILVDEADEMTTAAQNYLLSKLDSAAPVPNTIWIFTANSTESLKARFLSRCEKVKFSTHGQSGETATLLELVWESEAPAGVDAPNFARIVKEACNNVRESLMRLQAELRAARAQKARVA